MKQIIPKFVGKRNSRLFGCLREAAARSRLPRLRAPPHPKGRPGRLQAGTRQMVLRACRPAGRARALQIFQAPPSLRPLRPLRLKPPSPLPCAPRVPWFGQPTPLQPARRNGTIAPSCPAEGSLFKRTEDPAQRNKRKAGAMDNYAVPAEENGRAAGGTSRRSDGMTSREAPAGRIDHVDDGTSFEGKLFCTGGRSEGLRSPS